MRCGSHTFNLIATVDAAKSLETDADLNNRYVEVMDKCRFLWNKQQRSTLAAESMKDNFGRKLVVPGDTRWNSTYDSVKCLVEVIEKQDNLSDFNAMICADPVKAKKFTKMEVDFLKKYLEVFEPVASGLDFLQSEKTAYMGSYLPAILLTWSDLCEKIEKPELESVKPLIRALIYGMRDRFGDARKNMTYLLASAFHPGFKTEWMKKFLRVDRTDPPTERPSIARDIDSYLPRPPDPDDLIGQVQKTMKNLVFEELKKIQTAAETRKSKEKETPAAEREEASEEEGQQSQKGPGETSKERSWMSRLSSELSPKNVGDSTLQKKANSIVDAYLEMKTSNTTKENAFTDAVFMGETSLKNLFVKYNTGIPSSAGVERMFSIGKLILRDNRNRLSDDTFEKLMFIKGNMQNVIF